MQLRREEVAISLTVWALVWLVLAFGLNAVAGFDAGPVISWAAGSDARNRVVDFVRSVECGWQIGDRTDFIKFVLGIGLPSSFVTLLSVSLIALGQNVDAATILGHRRYALGWRRRIAILNRGNPLWSALLAVAAVTVSAGALWSAQVLRVGSQRAFVLSLLILAVGLLLEVVLVIRCVYWSMSLRATPHLVGELGASALNVLGHVARSGALTAATQGVRTADEEASWREQVEFLNIMDALEQVVVRTQQSGQAFAMRLAAYQLRVIHDRYYQSTIQQLLPSEWYAFAPARTLRVPARTEFEPGTDLNAFALPAVRLNDWVTYFVLRAFGRALRVAAMSNDVISGREVLRQVLPVTRDAILAGALPERSGFPATAIEEGLMVYREGLLASAAARAYELQEELIDNVVELISEQLALPGDQRALRDDDLITFVARLGAGCVDQGEAVVLTRILERIEGRCGVPLRLALVRAALQVAAHAALGAQWPAARWIIEWSARVDRRGTACARLARSIDRFPRSGLPEIKIADLGAIMLATLLEGDALYAWPVAVQNDIAQRLRSIPGVELRMRAIFDELTDDPLARLVRWRGLAP